MQKSRMKRHTEMVGRLSTLLLHWSFMHASARVRTQQARRRPMISLCSPTFLKKMRKDKSRRTGQIYSCFIGHRYLVLRRFFILLQSAQRICWSMAVVCVRGYPLLCLWVDQSSTSCVEEASNVDKWMKRRREFSSLPSRLRYDEETFFEKIEDASV